MTGGARPPAPLTGGRGRDAHRRGPRAARDSISGAREMLAGIFPLRPHAEKDDLNALAGASGVLWIRLSVPFRGISERPTERRRRLARRRTRALAAAGAATRRSSWPSLLPLTTNQMIYGNISSAAAAPFDSRQSDNWPPEWPNERRRSQYWAANRSQTNGATIATIRCGPMEVSRSP